MSQLPTLLAVLFVAFVVLFGIWMYFLPAWIASRKKARDKKAILFLNLFSGWTGFGWFIAFIWALTSQDYRREGEVTPFYLFPR